MRIHVPQFTGQYRNDIVSAYALMSYIEGLNESDQKELALITDRLSEALPLTAPQSEDRVVSAMLILMREIGWKAEDMRSTFIPREKLKPDIWLDNRLCFLECLSLKRPADEQDWTRHCEKTARYSKYAQASISFCSDGNRWFIVKSKHGSLTTASVAIKKYPKDSE